MTQTHAQLTGIEKMRQAKNIKRSSSDLFIKLQDKEEVKGYFRGDAEVFYRNFKTRQESPEWSKGLDYKFRINIIVREEGIPKAKIFEGGKLVSNLIVDMIDEYGTDIAYKIKRKGSGKDDTVYNIFPDPESKLSANQKVVIDSVELHDVSIRADNKQSQDKFSTTTPNGEPSKEELNNLQIDDDIPF